VTLVAAAVVPSPPALVPEVAAGAAGELAEVRAACLEAARRLLAAGPEEVVVVAPAPTTGWREQGERADLAAYGVDLSLHASGPGPDRLPLGHVIGRWVLERAGCTVPIACLGVAADLGSGACEALGAQAVAGHVRRAILCVGDGSARRGEASPRWPDPRAVPYDDAIAAAIGEADIGPLRALDVATAEDLVASGRAPWQVLAGAAAAAGSWRGTLLSAAAPYGVGYVVASWTRLDAETMTPARGGDLGSGG